MRQVDGVLYLGDGEIAGKASKAVILATQVNSVSPVVDGDFELFEVAGRGQQLYLRFLGRLHVFFSLHKSVARF